MGKPRTVSHDENKASISDALHRDIESRNVSSTSDISGPPSCPVETDRNQGHIVALTLALTGSRDVVLTTAHIANTATGGPGSTTAGGPGQLRV